MLKTEDLIKELDVKYHKMVSMVNIPDFTKCVAQFSGIRIENIKDEVIADYLKTWAANKYRFYLMFNEQLRIDTPFEYDKFRDDIEVEVGELSKQYPVFGPW